MCFSGGKRCYCRVHLCGWQAMMSGERETRKVRDGDRRVEIFKTYMNMMSEKVLILLCDVHSSHLFFSPLAYMCTHISSSRPL